VLVAVGCGRVGDSVTTPARHAVDLAFIEHMLPHDARAIAAAELARRRAGHLPLRRLAHAVVDRERADVGVMHATPSASDGAAVASLGLPAWKMRSALDARALRRSRRFDRAFITQLIADDDAAIHMAGIEAFYGHDATLRRLAHALVLQSAREIERVESWEKRWYGV
jgi:uncharacterized protein (DUF305 family)